MVLTIVSILLSCIFSVNISAKNNKNEKVKVAEYLIKYNEEMLSEENINTLASDKDEDKEEKNREKFQKKLEKSFSKNEKIKIKSELKSRKKGKKLAF